MQFLLQQCQSIFDQHQSIMLTMLLAGLVGGVTHCSGMCGPFVAAQTSQNDLTKNSTLQKLSGAALLPYHLGRMTTYMLLGMAAALLSKQIMGTPLQQWISVIFLCLAGVIFIGSALPQVKRILHVMPFSKSATIARTISNFAKPLFSSPKGLRGYGLGVLLGFLPCGLIFASLMIVSTTGSVATAAAAMMIFTIGTFPALFLVGFGSQFAYRRWPHSMQKVARAVMIFNGCSLFILAGNIVL